MADAALLSARGLGIERAGRLLFSDLDLDLLPGEIVHLRGANGAGKTTLLRILAGLSRFGFEGKVSRPQPALYLGHQSAVKPLLTPRENLRWHPSGEQFGDAGALEAALDSVGLYGYEDTPAGQLSAGQQRRVDLARLHLSERPLWLLDEPFTAIDVQGVARLQQRFARHAAGGGAVLLTSHQSLDLDHGVRIVDLALAA
ncbi:MAG: cytochrome c biogenesis heme-transporting ATPase CcmA [Halieaceae bacterium]|jgi:heme exporter protein A|nr:cytochrome c biogenesis heme-transporting ATPase CcmA [Halieaceae bacterium]